MIQIHVSMSCTKYMEEVFDIFEKMESKPKCKAGAALDVAAEYLAEDKIVKFTEDYFEKISDMVTDLISRKMQNYLENFDGSMETVIQFSRECQQVFHEAKEVTKDHLKMSLMLSIRHNSWPMRMLESYSWPMKSI